MAATFVRSKNGKLTIGGIVLVVVIVVLIVLLTGGNGRAKNSQTRGSAANNPGGSNASSSSASGSSSSATANGPSYSASSAADCLVTTFGSDHVSTWTAENETTVRQLHAVELVDVEGETESTSGALYFFSNSAKAAAAIPIAKSLSRFHGVKITQPNGGNALLFAGSLTSSDLNSTAGCLQ